MNNENTFVTYRLINQKSKGYKGLYAKLFRLLNKDSLFTECYDEHSFYEEDDMLVTCTWGVEGDLPKGIIEID
tara:strand:- start:38 stop:256 length:219 start_codon:yes stop_codon:yes gene_type:complete